MASSNTDSLKQFFERTIEGLRQDAEGKGQSIPVSSFRFESDELSGAFYAADYFKYLIYGRGPGKQPPPEKIIEWISRNPETQQWTDIEKNSLAFQIGRKIGREGTDIFSGKRPGIDLLGVMEKNMPELLTQLARNEVVKIATDLKAAVK